MKFQICAVHRNTRKIYCLRHLGETCHLLVFRLYRTLYPTRRGCGPHSQPTRQPQRLCVDSTSRNVCHRPPVNACKPSVPSALHHRFSWSLRIGGEGLEPRGWCCSHRTRAKDLGGRLKGGGTRPQDPEHREGTLLVVARHTRKIREFFVHFLCLPALSSYGRSPKWQLTLRSAARWRGG